MSWVQDRQRLRRRVLRSLSAQGFKMRDGRLVIAAGQDKAFLRKLHARAVHHNIERSREGLERHESQLLSFIASGHEVNPKAIKPRLVEVLPDSAEELLFRYCRLHWTIPVSSGYGRRLRFLVFDESNGKLIGLFGMGDPVFNLGPRDCWIGWSGEAKRQRLQCVMDLFVLGAVPPYSYLLCGKLVALLATSWEVQKAFRRKYAGQRSYIRQQGLDGRLALLTTTSALGRSSLYNRLTYRGRLVFTRVGFTQGFGEFQFINGLYQDLQQFALTHCEATSKHGRWGNGFRNRRELLRKVLPMVGLSRELVYHGVEREIFLAPLAKNTGEFLRGEHQRVYAHRCKIPELFAWFRQRWLLPRAARDQSFRSFESETFRLWRH